LRFDDLLRISFRQVIRQRRRNLAVALAIALGTAGFIVIITMGRDVKVNFNRDLDLLGGATLVKVIFEGPGDNPMIQHAERLRDETIDALKEIKGVIGVAPILTKEMYATSRAVLRDQVFIFNTVGVTEDYWLVNSFEALEGRLFGREEVDGSHLVCVLGAKLARRMFDRQDVVDEFVPIDGDLYRVVGVVGGVGLGDREEWAFIPLTTAQSRLPRIDIVRIAFIRCRTYDDVESVVQAIPKIVEFHQSVDGLHVEVSWDRLKTVKRTSWLIELFIYTSVTATLLLGAFGIWNIMMIAVRTRTREIGLKKAMGAEDRDILDQFLTEALCLSLGSALVGMVLGRVIVEVLSFLLDNRPNEQVFILAVGASLLLAVLVGAAAGLSPAVKASRMEVVSAVRYE
jgi:putative ABC transport system permease protein